MKKEEPEGFVKAEADLVNFLADSRCAKREKGKKWKKK